MTTGERKLCEWKAGMTGHFFTSLFECAGNADIENMERLAKGFPEEMAAFKHFRREDGYWERLCAEWKGGAA